MPHDKIVRAKFLKFFVRGTVLKKSVFSETEKDRSSNGAIPVACQDDETEPGLDDMFLDIQKKRRRLWRKTVTAPGLHMQLVKITNGLAIAYDRDPHTAAFCFAYRPANWTGEASHQLFRIPA